MTVRAILTAWLLAHGYAPHQAEAVVHQAYIESRLQPCARSHSGAWLFGWVGARRQALARHAGTPSCPPIETQLEFADRELRSPPYSVFWSAAPAESLRVLRECFGRGRCR